MGGHDDEKMRATIAGFLEILQSLTRIAEVTLYRLKLATDGGEPLVAGDPEVVSVIMPMLHMVGMSTQSVLLLASDAKLPVRDAYPIARAVVEGSVNILFIMAEGRAAAEKAKRHAASISYRNLFRSANIAGVQVEVAYEGSATLQDYPDVVALMAEFTTKSGREKPWSDKTIKQKIEMVTEKFTHQRALLLMGAWFGVYKLASEVVHGSYFGAVFFWGADRPRRKPVDSTEDLVEILREHQFAILSSVAFALFDLLSIIAYYIEEPFIGGLVEDQIAQLKALELIAEGLK